MCDCGNIWTYTFLPVIDWISIGCKINIEGHLPHDNIRQILPFLFDNCIL